MKNKKIIIWLFKGPYGNSIVEELKKKINIWHHVDFTNEKDLPSLSRNYNYLIKNFNSKKNKIYENNFLKKIYEKFFLTWKNYLFSRFNFDGLNFLDLDSVFKCQIIFFYEYLKKNKPNILIMGPNFGWGSDYLFYEISKAMGVKTLLLKNTFRDRFFYSNDMGDWGEFKRQNKNYNKIVRPNYINTENVKFWYMKKKFYMQQNFGLRIFFPFLKGIEEYGLSRTLLKNNFLDFINFKKNLDTYKFWKQENSRSFVSKKLPKKYILFAMHFQPESSTMSFGNNFIDQANAIELLREKLPSNYSIIIKDHARQTDQQHRSNIFYERIKSLKKVQITNVNDDIKLLLKNASAVATITGIIGFEAINQNKPVITFGKAWYNFLPFVYPWKSNLNLKKILKIKVKKSLIEKRISEFTQCMPPGVLYEKWGKKAYDFTTDFKKKVFVPSVESKKVANSILKLINDLK